MARSFQASPHDVDELLRMPVCAFQEYAWLRLQVLPECFDNLPVQLLGLGFGLVAVLLVGLAHPASAGTLLGFTLLVVGHRPSRKNWFRSYGSNVESSGSEPEMLPFTPLLNVRSR